jgi:O-antigen ligase
MSSESADSRFSVSFDWRVVWVLLFVGGLNLATRTVNEQSSSPIDLSTLHRVLIFVMLGVGLLVLLSRLKLLVPKVLLPLFAFLVWQVTTTYWSVFPPWTLYRAVEFAVLIVFGLVTAHAIDDERELWDWSTIVFCYFFAIVLLAWIGAVVAPDLALTSSASGLIPYMLGSVVPRLNPNSVSQVAAIAGVISIARYHATRNRSWIPVVVVAVLTMVASQGRSGMAGFAAGVVVLGIARGYWRQIVYKGLAGLSTVVVVPQLRATVVSLLVRGQTLETLLSLSGRTHKWLFALEYMISDGPLALLFGYGAYAGARFVVTPNDPRRVDSAVASSTHNTWMDLWTDIGLIGVLLFAVAMFLICRRLVRWWRAQSRIKRLLATEISAVLAVLLVRSMFSRALILHNSVYFAFAIGFITFYHLRAAEAKSRPGPG